MLTDTALDIDQFLHSELFQSQSPPSVSSSPSSPEQGLLTPPQSAPLPAFHDASDSLAQPFSFFDDEIKAIDALNSASPFDFLTAPLDHSISGYPLPMDLGYMNMGFNMPMPEGMAIDPQLVDTPASTGPISDDFDGEDGDDEASNSAGTSPAAVTPAPAATSAAVPEKDEARDKLTLTIAPIKVGGHGKARRGTVQSGGISKKSATGAISVLHRGDQENLFGGAHSAVLPPSTASSPAPQIGPSSPSTSTKPFPKPPAILKASTSKKGKVKDIVEDDDEDDVPQDWRPSPEVFAKMTSKEKRQLRNKISARNFRVRRKEYISTLEGDIAERDRLLDAIRSELGSTQSENLALRQEITALKKILLEGRGAADLPSLNLPPPAPLPVGLGAITTALPSAATPLSEGMAPSPPGTPAPTVGTHQQINATSSVSTPSIAPSTSASAFTPNIQKDLPSSPTPRPFWGGQHTSILGGLGGGITPVHTTLVPEINLSLWGSTGAGAGRNINPLLNAIGKGVTGSSVPTSLDRTNEREKAASTLQGFDAFADTNLFTMKSLDAYRMQLWGKMAAQHHAHNQQFAQQQQQQRPTSPFLPHQQTLLTGPASSLRPAYFTSPSLTPKTSAGPGSSLTGLLSGKHSPSTTGLLTPPASPHIGAARGASSSSQTQKESTAQREREAQAAMLAAVASQTLFKKLGNAFWDAFSGSSPPSSSTSPLYLSSPTHTSPQQQRSWDADKVRKVLEGKAVVKVVDLEPVPTPTLPASTSSCSARVCEDVRGCVTDILEESMRSLTLGTKGSVSPAGARK